ncbi:hypothetical protein JVX92_15060 (plasmid) [Microbacterium hominis]|uniref:hypothetical protein n=1 Tax=Microbacterium hominis TaxID=162426 RepID=UPI0019644CAE|nr:hypothetical protein [Microbacterium hominis]QRY42300.1 hypothetical protein JVX92_15060 [Microbacterium hominis]
MTENDTPEQPVEAAAAEELAPVKNRRRMPWWAWAGIAAAAIAAAIVIPLSVTAASHTAALDAYRQSTSTATEAADTATKAAAQLAATSAAAASEADALQAIVDQTPAELVADPATRVAAAAAIAQLRASATTPAIDVPTIAEWGSLQESASTDDLNNSATTAASYTSTTASLVSQASAAQAKISDDLTAAQTAIDNLVASAAAKGATLVYDRAGDGEKQALTAAVAALQARKAGAERPSTADTASLVGSYVAAVNAAKASHDAAIAADQNSTGGGDSGNTGGSGGGGSWGGSGGSSGGGSSDGSNGGGSGSSGGGTTSWPRGALLQGSRPCEGSGGSSSANWVSVLRYPADSTVTNVWENQAGDEWGISWQCNAIDF